MAQNNLIMPGACKIVQNHCSSEQYDRAVLKYGKRILSKENIDFWTFRLPGQDKFVLAFRGGVA